MGADLLGHDPDAITVADKVAEIEKELNYRRWVYPQQIEKRKMTQATAGRRLKVMEAILADYQGGKVMP